MNVSTTAIVLKAIKYGDTSLILHTFTKSHGKLAFIVKGARKSKAKIKANMIQPLSLIEIDFRLVENKDLHYLNECRMHTIYASLQQDMAKTALGIYLLEILNRSIPQGEEHPSLFDFVQYFLLRMDETKDSTNWHFYFLLELSKYLGFYPTNNFSEENCHFDPDLGIFNSLEAVSYQLEKEQSYYLSLFLFSSLDDIHDHKIQSNIRLSLLKELERFYAHHVPNFGDIRSLSVYRTVFN